jgi:hypothetical protein
MLNAIVVVRFVILSFGGHGHVALENVALRQQLAVFKRDNKRPRLLRRSHKALWWTRTIKTVASDIHSVQPKISWNSISRVELILNDQKRTMGVDTRLFPEQAREIARELKRAIQPS